MLIYVVSSDLNIVLWIYLCFVDIGDNFECSFNIIFIDLIRLYGFDVIFM